VYAYTKLVGCERLLNVQTSKQRDKKWQLVGAFGGGRNTMVQPAKWLIRHCTGAPKESCSGAPRPGACNGSL